MDVAARYALNSRLVGARTWDRWVRRRCGSVVVIALLSAAVSTARSSAAQSAPSPQDPPELARLTTRPRELGSGGQNRAGEYRLDSLSSEHLVYVPRSCEGRRCPLLVSIPWAGKDAKEVAAWFEPAAEKHGIILLATANFDALSDQYKPDLDAALKQVFQKFSVDPAKVAVAGHCASGGYSMRLGVANLDIFSRIAVVSYSGGDPVDVLDLDPKNRTAEFIMDGGYDETSLLAAELLRREGRRVKSRIGFRHHQPSAEDFDFLGRWLQESWTIADPAARPAPVVVAKQLPALTVDALARMTTFWKRFMAQPDSIVNLARMAHLREVAVPIGRTAGTTIPMVDMAALAARYPSVAAALKEAGLTARQHDAYRIALVSAYNLRLELEGQRTRQRLTTDFLDKDITARERRRGAPFDPTRVKRLKELWVENLFTVNPASVQGKNVAFLDAHPDELTALENTGMWTTP